MVHSTLGWPCWIGLFLLVCNKILWIQNGKSSGTQQRSLRFCSSVTRESVSVSRQLRERATAGDSFIFLRQPWKSALEGLSWSGLGLGEGPWVRACKPSLLGNGIRGPSLALAFTWSMITPTWGNSLSTMMIFLEHYLGLFWPSPLAWPVMTQGITCTWHFLPEHIHLGSLYHKPV